MIFVILLIHILQDFPCCKWQVYIFILVPGKVLNSIYISVICDNFFGLDVWKYLNKIFEYRNETFGIRPHIPCDIYMPQYTFSVFISFWFLIKIITIFCCIFNLHCKCVSLILIFSIQIKFGVFISKSFCTELSRLGYYLSSLYF